MHFEKVNNCGVHCNKRQDKPSCIFLKHMICWTLQDRLLKCVQMIEDLTEIAASTDLPDGTVSVAARAGSGSPVGVLDAAFLSYRIYGRTVVSDPSSSNAANQDPKRRRLD